jgi:hypothetical protein
MGGRMSPRQHTSQEFEMESWVRRSDLSRV